MAAPQNPVKGQRYTEGDVTREFDGSNWRLVGESRKAGGESGPSAPKIQSKGYSSSEETQTKSLSQILKEREEKRRKAEIIKAGGAK